MDRQTKRDWLWLAVLGLLVQAFWAARLAHPSYFDAYYYTIGGQQLATGQGFTEPVIWQYLDDPAGLPKPSHTYWMPLTSMVAAAGYWVHDSFRGAQLPFWLMAGLLPLLSYAISRRFSAERWQARTAARFTMAGGYYAAYWNQPSTFVLFAWVGGGCLFALALAQARQRGAYWLVAGVLAGLAHLTRADGLVLLAVALWVWLLGVRDVWRAQTGQPRLALQGGQLLLLLAGYLLVMGGWFYRTWLLSGRVLSTVGTQTIFLTDYNDLFAYNRQFDLAGYLAWGWGNILRSKLDGLWLSLQTYVGVVGLTAFSFFVVVGWLRVGQGRTAPERVAIRRFLRPVSWYALALFIAMSLIFTFPGGRGSLLHSSTALWPWSMALAAAGIGLSVDWIAARRSHWNPQVAKRFFAVTFVLLVFMISLAVSGGQPLREAEGAVYAEIGAALPAGSIVMSGSAPNFYYHTGLMSIVTPNEPPAGVLAAARQFGADYLLLDPDRPPPLAGLYAGEVSLPELVLRQTYPGGFQLYQILPPGELP